MPFLSMKSPVFSKIPGIVFFGDRASGIHGNEHQDHKRDE